MKNYIIACVTLLIGSSVALAQNTPSSLKSWIDEDQKLVYFLPNPLLKLRVVHLGADDEYWDELAVDFSYSESNPEFQKASADLQAAHPGYKFVKVLISDSMGTHVSIPSLNVEDDVDTKLAIDGPYFEKNYYISRAKSAALRSEYQNPDFILVAGNVRFSAPFLKILESKELESTVCSDLLSSGKSLYSVMGQFSKLSQWIDSIGLKYDSTKEMLKVSALVSCLNVPDQSNISSFKELLSLKVEQNLNHGRIYGETSKTMMIDMLAPYNPFTTKETLQ